LQLLNTGIKALHKTHGETLGGKGARFAQFDRLPTGIITLDLALGGGIPMNAVSIFYGPEGSGKTSLTLRTMAQYQRRFPKKKIAFIDGENAWDEQWATLHGINCDEIFLFKPTTAEEAADIADEVAFSKDAGLLVVDSLAALASIAQVEKQSHEVVIAGAAKPLTTMCKKIGAGMAEHSKNGEQLTVIYVNQVRNRIGGYGNPEILPGPSLQNYQAFLKLRLVKKDILKEKLAAVAIYSENSMKITKKKFPCIRQTAEWQTILYPYGDHKPLEVNNALHLTNILDELGYLEKAGKEWALYGEIFPTKKAAITAALNDYDKTLEMLVEDLLLLYKDGEPVEAK